MLYVQERFHTDDFPIKLADFRDKKELYIKRPPYQRKSVWPLKKQQKFIESLFRKYFVPRIVLRIVIPHPGTQKFDIIDGQQRVISIQNFFEDEFRTSRDLNTIKEGIGNKLFSELSVDCKEYFEELVLKTTVIKTIDNPENSEHQELVTDIFWRLNEGISLSGIEKEHSKLNSAVRNFAVKYADDISFDDDMYVSIDKNNQRHGFFDIVSQKNDRLQNLALLIRFLMIEFSDGPTELKDTELSEFVDKFQNVPLDEFESRREVRNCLKLLNNLYSIFKNDDLKDTKGKIILLNREYFMVSLYILLKELSGSKYNFGQENYEAFRVFMDTFFKRWKEQRESDHDIIHFSNSRQQDRKSIISRDVIIRKSFFKENPNIEKLDAQRNFKLWQRIAIYQRDGGICKHCENKIAWKDFEADHVVPHSKTGETNIENGQLLCSHCNKTKSNKTEFKTRD